jgi:hypothetical protein
MRKYGLLWLIVPLLVAAGWDAMSGHRTQSAPAVTMTPSPRGPSVTPTPSVTPGITPTPTLSGTPLPTLKADLMGVQINTDLSDEDFAIALWYAKQLGVRWVKFQFAWDLLEPEQGLTSQAFFRYRLFVQRAKQEGFNVLVSLAKAPDWARVTAEEDGPPRDPQLLANFISMLLGDIRTDLLGRSYVDAIEVWNEPNLRREWNGGTLSGADYMRLFDAAYHAIRAAEGGPGIVIVTAGLAPTGVNDGVQAVNDRVYLQQMYSAGLADPRYQNVVIGAHPYGAWNPPDARCCGNSDLGYDKDPTFFFLDNIEDLRDIMVQNGDAARPIWITEFGWGTYTGLIDAVGGPAPTPPGHPYFGYIDDWQMANYIMRAFELGQTLSYLGPMILWNLNFAGPAFVELQDPRSAYAILGNTFDPRRPAYILIQLAPKIGTPTPTP